MSISYDTQTSYSKIAAICGCISIVVPEEGKSRRDYISTNEKCYGVAYGYSKEEINFSLETQEKALQFYKDLNEKSMNQIKSFVKKCEEYFN